MRSFLRAIAELLVVAAILFALLLLVVSLLPGDAPKGRPPTSQEISLFTRECDGRTILVRNKLECRP